jgi:hypothetical protein
MWRRVCDDSSELKKGFAAVLLGLSAADVSRQPDGDIYSVCVACMCCAAGFSRMLMTYSACHEEEFPHVWSRWTRGGLLSPDSVLLDGYTFTL